MTEEGATLRGVTGSWAGTYFYDDGPAPRPPVYFFADLVLEQGHLRGEVIEPNTFGDASQAELRASVHGAVAEDGAVRFFKIYDGSAGVAHTVEYEGWLDPERTRIEGSWQVGSGASGTFVMTRQSRRPGLARGPAAPGSAGPRRIARAEAQRIVR